MYRLQLEISNNIPFHRFSAWRQQRLVSQQGQWRLLRLSQNYPNPFNPETRIDYEVPALSHVRIVVYDLQGRGVRRLLEATKSAGRYVVSWNGKSDDGAPAASGVYLIRMAADDFVRVRKVLLTR